MKCKIFICFNFFLKSNSQNGIGETNQTFFMQEIEARTYVTNTFNMQIHDTDLK